MSLNVCAHKVIEFFTKLKVLLYSSAKTNTFAFRLMQAATRCTKACSMHRMSIQHSLHTPVSRFPFSTLEPQDYGLPDCATLSAISPTGGKVPSTKLYQKNLQFCVLDIILYLWLISEH